MAAWSPTIEGFRSIFRRPALPLAEVAWRWSFGAAAFVLVGLGLLEYLNTLPVSPTDLLMLRTGHPVLVPDMGDIAESTRWPVYAEAVVERAGGTASRDDR